LARELAESSADWTRPVGRVAEDVARWLAVDADASPLPTPLSGRNRSAGRRAVSRPAPGKVAVPLGRRCSWCGGRVEQKRRTCSPACAKAARDAQDKPPFYAAGPGRLKELRAAGVEPVGPEARARIGRRQTERQAQENTWNAAHGQRANPDVFRRDVLPALQGVPLRELARRTGLSVAYCARIRRGDEVPHARWWARVEGRSLDDLAGRQDSNTDPRERNSLTTRKCRRILP